jgi:catalase
VEQDEVRGKPEKFAEHFNQAALFFNSQTAVEQAHIAAAFRFELSKLTVPAIRRRVLSLLRNASEDLAAKVAGGLGMDLPEAMPKALSKPPKPEVTSSEALSMFARPGPGGITTRKVAIFVGDGVNGNQVSALQKALLDGGAVGRLIGHRVGPFTAQDGSTIDADVSFENEPSVLFDAVAIPDGDGTAKAWARDGRAGEFVKDQFRHLKTILALGDAVSFLEGAGVPMEDADPGLLLHSEPEASFVSGFIEALAQHKHFVREADPPVL